MDSVYVYSTLSNDQRYRVYRSGGIAPVVETEVFIRGKANVALRNKSGGLETSLGAVTKITEEELEQLQKCYVFNIHVKNGHIKIEKGIKSLEKAKDLVAKSVEDMNTKDDSAPKVESDFNPKDDRDPDVVGDGEKGNRPAPIESVGKKKVKPS